VWRGVGVDCCSALFSDHVPAPLHDGALLIGLCLNPGVRLVPSLAIASQAEVLSAEVTYVGRRSGCRSKLDEHCPSVSPGRSGAEHAAVRPALRKYSGGVQQRPSADPSCACHPRFCRTPAFHSRMPWGTTFDGVPSLRPSN
jgi:hypothetical protein